MFYPNVFMLRSNLGSAVQDTENARDVSKNAVENLRNAAKVLKLDIQAGSPSRQELIELSNAIDAVLSNFTASDKAVSKLQPAVDRTNTKVKQLLNSSEIAAGMKIVPLRALFAQKVCDKTSRQNCQGPPGKYWCNDEGQWISRSSICN